MANEARERGPRREAVCAGPSHFLRWNTGVVLILEGSPDLSFPQGDDEENSQLQAGVPTCVTSNATYKISCFQTLCYCEGR